MRVVVFLGLLATVVVVLLVVLWLRNAERATGVRSDVALDSTGTRISPGGELGTSARVPDAGPSLGDEPVLGDVARLPEPDGPSPAGAQWDERRGVWIRWDPAAGAWVDVD